MPSTGSPGEGYHSATTATRTAGPTPLLPDGEQRLEVVSRVDLEGHHRVGPRHARQLRDLARDDLRELLGLAEAEHGHEVPLAGHRVRLGHPLEVRQLAAQRGQRRSIRLDQDDRVGHVECDCPGSSTTTFERVADSTSDLNAWASVSIGGN